jgi:Flp pilus assembly protein TadB
VDQQAVESNATDRSAGKGTPTPRRKDQEAARKRPLVPNDRKAAKEAERAAMQQQRLQTRRAMETGDERYLPVRDKGPQRRFARDFVDARWNVGEFLMIAALVFVVLTFIPNLTLQSVVLIAFWAMFLLVAVDSFILGRKLKRRLVEKFTTPEPGVVWYGVMRGLQFRKLRLPKPMVARGEYPR